MSALDLINKIDENRYLKYIEEKVNELSVYIEEKIKIINEINNDDPKWRTFKTLEKR